MSKREQTKTAVWVNQTAVFVGCAVPTEEGKEDGRYYMWKRPLVKIERNFYLDGGVFWCILVKKELCMGKSLFVRISISVPPDLYQEIIRSAALSERTFTGEVVFRLKRSLEAEKPLKNVNTPTNNH